MCKKRAIKISFAQLTLFTLFFTSLISAAASGVTQDTVDLYTIYTSLPEFHVTNDLDFGHGVTVNPEGNVLQGDEGATGNIESNAVVCPGDVIVGSSLNGQWAASGFSALYPYAFTCIPPSQGLATNRNVHWSEDDYDALQTGGAICIPEESCWGNEGSLTSQRVSYETIDATYSNRLGYVSTVCYGQHQLRLLNRNTGSSVGGGTYMAMTNPPTTTSFTHTYDLEDGNYQARAQFFVNGCTTVVRPPACAGDQEEGIFDRIAAENSDDAPEYEIDLPLRTLNFEVQDRQYSADDTDSDPESGDVVCMEAEETLAIRTTVRNTGDSNDAGVEVYDVSANRGFAAEPLYGGGPCVGFCLYDGFGYPIAPAARATPTQPVERDVTITLTAPGSLAPDTITDVVIRYDYRPVDPVCTTTDSRAFFVNYRINSSPACVPPGTGCVLDPLVVSDIEPGTLQPFTISCVEEGDPVDCTGVTWSADAALGASFFAPGDSGATARFSNPDSSGRVNATTRDYGVCTADITVGSADNDTTTGCTLDPEDVILDPGEEQTFTIRCTEEGVAADCGTVTWDADAGLGPDFVSMDDDAATVRFMAPDETGELVATTEAGHICDAKVETRAGGIENGCALAPPTVSLDSGDTQAFDLACYVDFAEVECDGTAWEASASLGADFVSASDSGAMVEFSGDDTVGFVTANVASLSYKCDAMVTIGDVVPENDCLITPTAVTLESGSTQSFDLACYVNFTEVECMATNWIASGVLNAVILSEGDDGAEIQFNGENVTSRVMAIVTRPDYTCDANVNLVPRGAGNQTGGDDGTGPTDQSCQLSHTVLRMQPGGRATVTITCPEEPNGICPSPPAWELRDIGGGSFEGMVEREEITPPPEDGSRGTVVAALAEGQGYLIATVGEYACHTFIDVGGLYCGDYA